jgi:hypothetical protein
MSYFLSVRFRSIGPQTPEPKFALIASPTVFDCEPLHIRIPPGIFWPCIYLTSREVMSEKKSGDRTTPALSPEGIAIAF